MGAGFGGVCELDSTSCSIVEVVGVSGSSCSEVSSVGDFSTTFLEESLGFCLRAAFFSEAACFLDLVDFLAGAFSLVFLSVVSLGSSSSAIACSDWFSFAAEISEGALVFCSASSCDAFSFCGESVSGSSKLARGGIRLESEVLVEGASLVVEGVSVSSELTGAGVEVCSSVRAVGELSSLNCGAGRGFLGLGSVSRCSDWRKRG